MCFYWLSEDWHLCKSHIKSKKQDKQGMSDMQILNWQKSFVFNYGFATAENYKLSHVELLCNRKK